MEQLGNVLVQAREQMGLTVEDVSQITKIRSKYIRALESGKVYEIPGRVYALGFLKSYCEVLDLNYRELQEYFNANYQEKDEFVKHITTAAVQQPTHQTGISSKRVVLFALLGACILLGGVYLFVNNQEKTQPPVLPPVADNLKQSENKEQQPNNLPGFNWNAVMLAADFNDFDLMGIAPIHYQEGVEVVVEATGTCWTRVTIDDADSSDETLHAGDIRTYQGINKVEIKWGNAGLVKVTVNGVLQNQDDIGAVGQVVTKEFLAE